MATQVSFRAEDLKVLRAGLLATGVIAPVAAVAAGLTAGAGGAVAALLGVALVVAFFSVSMVLVTAAGRVSPQLMFSTAMTTYLVKILLLVGVLFALRGVTVFPPKVFAWTVIGATVVWLIAEVRLVMTAKVLYVAPGEG